MQKERRGVPRGGRVEQEEVAAAGTEQRYSGGITKPTISNEKIIK